MAGRPIWNGVISFGMVSIPVGLFTAVSEKDVRFNQIHEPCGTRVKLQKYCPVHDAVVPNDEIVKGYEISKGKYVIMEEKDFENLPVASKHTIEVTSFAKSEEVDPMLFDSSYYVHPSEAGRKPYKLLMAALEERGVAAIAKIAMRSKETLCLIRATGGGLIVETLYYPDEIKKPEENKLDDIKVDDRELKMALSLVDMLEEPFDPSQYEDEYRKTLMHTIEEKAQGHTIQVTEADKTDNVVIDLMEALQKSVEAAKNQKKLKKAS